MNQSINEPEAKQIPGYTVKVYHHKDGISRVYRPILTEEEYEKRHQQLYNAAVRFLTHVEEVKQRKKEAEKVDTKD
nr:MAG TPA: hypothetical protein [Caudoviricetes sp.]